MIYSSSAQNKHKTGLYLGILLDQERTSSRKPILRVTRINQTASIYITVKIKNINHSLTIFNQDFELIRT